jgi:Lon-like protease
VGGVRYKVRAAEKAGAVLFLVPQDNLAEARQAARTMRVVPVQTFGEALAALRS